METSPRQLWYWWKSLRLPWRKKWLCGTDLTGNTFWEFKDALHAGRARRIVKSRWRTHHADVQLAPQWIQWLRHTRANPPTIQEQKLDQVRRVQLRQLAAEADKRWAEKPSFLDPPTKQQPALESQTRNSPPVAASTESEAKQEDGHAAVSHEHSQQTTQGNDEGSRKARSARVKDKAPWSDRPGAAQETQPDAWTPQANRRR